MPRVYSSDNLRKSGVALSVLSARLSAGPARADSKILRFSSAWSGTKYLAGSRSRGAGVDCAQLVAAFLDFMSDADKPCWIPRMASDVGLHDPEAAKATVRALLRAHPAWRLSQAYPLRPGDVILTRASHDCGGPEQPGHAMIVMPGAARVLHATPSEGVCVGPLEVNRGLLEIYRVKDKSKWQR